MVAGCAPLLLAIKETMGIGGTRQTGKTKRPQRFHGGAFKFWRAH